MTESWPRIKPSVESRVDPRTDILANLNYCWRKHQSVASNPYKTSQLFFVFNRILILLMNNFFLSYVLQRKISPIMSSELIRRKASDVKFLEQIFIQNFSKRKEIYFYYRNNRLITISVKIQF